MEDAVAVELGTEVLSWCSEGYFRADLTGDPIGSSNVPPNANANASRAAHVESAAVVASVCALSCALNPPAAKCERHACDDILQVFDFSTAVTSNIDWTSRYYGDQVRVLITCPVLVYVGLSVGVLC